MLKHIFFTSPSCFTYNLLFLFFFFFIHIGSLCLSWFFTVERIRPHLSIRERIQTSYWFHFGVVYWTWAALPLFIPRSVSFFPSFRSKEKRKCMHGKANSEKITDKFYDLVGFCVEAEEKRKKKPELLNIYQDDNKMEKMYEKMLSTMHKMLH